MKKILQLTLFSTFIFGFVPSCTPVEPGLKLDAPTELAVGALTESTAELSWKAVDGAERYRVAIGESAPLEVANAACTASGLAAQTAYAWKVQALGNGIESRWSESSSFRTLEEESKIEGPTDLAVRSVIHNRATLSWYYADAVDYFALVIGENEELLVSTLSYEAVDLKPGTTYTWKVRARVNGQWSKWTRGEEFATGADGIEFVYSNEPVFWDTRCSQSTSWFWLNFFSFDIKGTDLDGWQIGLDVISVLTDRSPTKEYLDIPAGTYTFSDKADKNVVYLKENTALVEMKDGRPIEFPTITGGTMTVAGDHTDYTITMSATLADGRVFTAYYRGDIYLRNPYYVKPSGKTVNLGAFTAAAQFEYVPDAYKNGSIDAWLIRAYQSPGVYMENNRWKGTGWVCDIQLHAPVNSGRIIPDHEYTVDRSGRPWTSLAGNGSNGFNAQRLELGVTIHRIWLVMGKMTSTYRDGSYRIDVEAIDSTSGDLYTFELNLQKSYDDE